MTNMTWRPPDSLRRQVRAASDATKKSVNAIINEAVRDWLDTHEAEAPTIDEGAFWARVDRTTDDCWTWQGKRDKQGYGRLHGNTFGASTSLAHRVAWTLTHGDPGELCVLHRCDNPPCVRPEHLFLGSRADNTADMVSKGRGKAGAQPFESRTHGTRNAHAKLTEDLVIEMRKRALAGERYQDLAVAYGISESRANAIIIGNGWRHVWPYSETSRPETGQEVAGLK